MKFNLMQIFFLALVCATLVLADSEEEDSVQRLLRTPKRKIYGRSRDDSVEAAPSGSAGGRDNSDSDESYYDNPKYRFAYQVRAKGPSYKKYGYGDDSSDNDEGQQGGDDSGDADSAEFGHGEMRDGQRTDGKYYVQLPDGRLQTVTYHVDGDSGFVAKVSYDNSGDDSGESDGGAVGGIGVGPSAGPSAGAATGARQGKDYGDDSDSEESSQGRRHGGKKYNKRG